jgi:hypothetical protein
MPSQFGHRLLLLLAAVTFHRHIASGALAVRFDYACQLKLKLFNVAMSIRS